MTEFRRMQRSTDEEIGTLRVSLRARDEECQRVTHIYEQNMLLVKETKLESESLKAKIDLLKTEYYKVEAMAREGTAEIRAELSVAKERLSNYEHIEKQLDDVIVGAAANYKPEDDLNSRMDNSLMQSIASAPTNANRRIQQSLMLANRLQAKQRELETTQKEVQQLKKKLDTSEADLTLNKRLLTKTNQPNSYMIADIEKSERELDFAQRKIKSLEEQVRKLKVENDHLKMAKKNMQTDL